MYLYGLFSNHNIYAKTRTSRSVIMYVYIRRSLCIYVCISLCCEPQIVVRNTCKYIFIYLYICMYIQYVYVSVCFICGMYCIMQAVFVLCANYFSYLPFLSLFLYLSVSLAGLSSNHANHSPLIRWDMRGIAGVVNWGFISGLCFGLLCETFIKLGYTLVMLFNYRIV